VLLSAGIHFSILVIAFLGLPDWFSKKIEPQPMVITLENLPITDRTNVRPSQQPVVRQKQPPTPVKAPPKPPTSKPKPPPPPPQPKAEPEKPKEKTEAEPIPKKEAIKKPTPPKDKPKPTPPAKKPTKETPKPDPKSSEVDEIEEALKNIEEIKNQAIDDKAKPVKKPTPAANQTKSDAPFDASLPLSISEKDAITSQFVQCWRIPAGAASDYSLKVSVDVWLRPDGSVIKAHLTGDQRGKYNSDGVFRAAADSALRAVHMCSPLKNLPTNKYNSWKEMRLNFDPSMQLY
jgi:hypothetical protein